MLDEHLVQLLRSRNKLPKLPPIITEASQTQDLASILVRSTQHDAEVATFRDWVRSLQDGTQSTNASLLLAYDTVKVIEADVQRLEQDAASARSTV